MGRPPMTGMDDVEKQQPPHGDTEILDKKNKAARSDSCNLCIALIITVVTIACMYGPFLLFDLDANYYAAIDSVSDLDPAREISFNLTVGLTSRGHALKSCFEPGTYVEVSYRGVPLAASEAQVGRLCGRRGESIEQRVSAKVTRVPVGAEMDILAVDVRQATPVFDITLHLPAGSYGVKGGENWASRCRGGGVGGCAVWCDVPNQEPSS